MAAVGVSLSERIYAHEVKPEPTERGGAFLDEAYGFGKCPKLVRQVESTDREVRRYALAALCEEFRNPGNVAGCARAGVFKTLPKYVLDDDDVTRLAAAKALARAAADSNGRESMLQENFASVMLPALDDSSDVVRASIYQVLLKSASTPTGLQALVDSGFPARLVEKARSEVEHLRPKALMVLCSLIRDGGGLQAALDCRAVPMVIQLLREPHNAQVIEAAACALGAMCFSDMAKIYAIDCEAIACLAALLPGAHEGARAAIFGALMSITALDAGKHAIKGTSVTEHVVECLRDGASGKTSSRATLNALKLVASIAAEPGIRSSLMEGSLQCLSYIATLECSPNALVSKHAKIASLAVQWKP